MGSLFLAALLPWEHAACPGRVQDASGCPCLCRGSGHPQHSSRKELVEPRAASRAALPRSAAGAGCGHRPCQAQEVCEGVGARLSHGDTVRVSPGARQPRSTPTRPDRCAGNAPSCPLPVPHHFPPVCLPHPAPSLPTEGLGRVAETLAWLWCRWPQVIRDGCPLNSWQSTEPLELNVKTPRSAVRWGCRTRWHSDTRPGGKDYFPQTENILMSQKKKS